jgi:hypothetical protein
MFILAQGLPTDLEGVQWAGGRHGRSQRCGHFYTRGTLWR